jgi:hypothetical protein
VSAYPDRARERALAALNAIEGEVMIIRRRIADGATADHDTKILTDAVRRLTQNLTVLDTLRVMGERRAAGTTVEGIAVWDAAKDAGPGLEIAPGAITLTTEDWQ